MVSTDQLKSELPPQKSKQTSKHRRPRETRPSGHISAVGVSGLPFLDLGRDKLPGKIPVYTKFQWGELGERLGNYFFRINCYKILQSLGIVEQYGKDNNNVGVIGR